MLPLMMLLRRNPCISMDRIGYLFAINKSKFELLMFFVNEKIKVICIGKISEIVIFNIKARKCVKKFLVVIPNDIFMLL